MIRVEYPRLLGTDEAKKVAAKTMDPMEFLAGLASRGKLKKDFKTGAGNISYHMPCHLRAQNVGYKTRDVLALLPDTTVKVVEECSGHDGTWAMKKENFEQSLKWGSRAFQRHGGGQSESHLFGLPAGGDPDRARQRPPRRSIRCRFSRKVIAASRSSKLFKRLPRLRRRG